jgi:hypothetical protein
VKFFFFFWIQNWVKSEREEMAIVLQNEDFNQIKLELGENLLRLVEIF